MNCEQNKRGFFSPTIHWDTEPCKAFFCLLLQTVCWYKWLFRKQQILRGRRLVSGHSWLGWLSFQVLNCLHKVGVGCSQRLFPNPSSFLFKQLLLSRDSQPHSKPHSLLQCSLLPLDAPSPQSHWEYPVLVMLHTNPRGKPQLPLE